MDLFKGRKGRLEIVTTVQPEAPATSEQPEATKANDDQTGQLSEAGAPVKEVESELPAAKPRKKRSDAGVPRAKTIPPQPAPVQPAAEQPTAPQPFRGRRG